MSLMRRLLLLNGWAILAVVAHHATTWGYTAMFWWTDRYLPVSVPNYDLVGSGADITLAVVRKLTVFAVPAFLFVSGFFVTYAARGSGGGLKWKTVLTRVGSLLVPYLIWSVATVAAEAIEGLHYGWQDYVSRLFLGDAFFFVPLLCQLYLLAPFIVPLAQQWSRRLLVGLGLLLCAVVALFYARLYGEIIGAEWGGLGLVIAWLPNSSVFRWAFFFALGMVCALHLSQLKSWLAARRWWLLGATVLFGCLSVLETELAVHAATTADWWRSSPFTVPSALYAVGVVLSFLAFAEVQLPLQRYIYHLGKSSLGIYLLHYKVLEFAARGLQKYVPGLLAYTLPFVLLIVVLAIAVPLALMWLVEKSPLRRYHRYLFG